MSPERKRKGFLISVGAREHERYVRTDITIVKTWFHVLEIEYAGDLLLSKVDEKGAVLKQPDALQKAYEAGQKLAEGLLKTRCIFGKERVKGFIVVITELIL